MSYNNKNEFVLSAEQVKNGEHEKYSPQRHDFYWNEEDGSVRVIALLWWDDASYIAYQSDCGDD